MAEAAGSGGGAPLKETTPESKPIRGTRREEQGAGTPEQVATPPAGLPRELAGRYRELTGLPHGSQAAVWRAKDEAGVDVAIKVYDRGFEADAAVLDMLAGLARDGREHLVGLVEHGATADGRLYEVQEYLAQGTLADLMERTRPSSSDSELVREVVRELAEALVYLHDAGIDHQDLKPGNVFVRSEAPLDLVLGDFGTSSQVAGTVRVTQLRGMTWPYAPPEAFVPSRDQLTLWRHKYDWWAVGIMVVEMRTGEHPLPGTGTLIPTYLLTRSLDDLVEGVRDPAWRKLCRGLLRRDPENRWGADEVRRWLDGPGDPELQVVEEGVPAWGGFRFVGKNYETPQALRAAFADDWSSAGKVWTARSAELQTWLRDDLGARDAEDRLDEIDAGLDLDAQLFLVLRALDPTAPPSFQGVELTEDKLARLAREAARKPAERAGQVLRALHGSGALAVAGSEVPALGSLADSWVGALADYERLRRESASRSLPLTDVERTLLIAAATPGSGVTSMMRDRARRVLDDKPLARDCEWFQPLGTVTDAGGPALLAMTYLAEAAHAEGRARQREAEQRRRAARAERLAGAVWGAAVGGAAGLLYLGTAAWGVGWPLVALVGFVVGGMAVVGARSSGEDGGAGWAFLIGGGLGAAGAGAWFWAVTRSFEQLGAWLPASRLTLPLFSGFVALGVGLGILVSLPSVRVGVRLAFTWTGGALGALLLTITVSAGVLAAAAAAAPERVAEREETAPDAGATPAAVEQALDLDAADRGRIQEGLAVAGFDPGPVRGDFDASTRAAIRDWQRAGGAAPTGYLDGDAVGALIELLADDAARQAATGAEADGRSVPGRAADEDRPRGPGGARPRPVSGSRSGPRATERDSPPVPTIIREAERRAAAQRDEELRRAAALRDEELRRSAVVLEDGLNADRVRSGPFGVTIGNEIDRPRRQRALANLRQHHEGALSRIGQDHTRALVAVGRDHCTSLLLAGEPSEAELRSAAEEYDAAITSAAAAHDAAVRTAADRHDDAVQAAVEGRTISRNPPPGPSARPDGGWDPRCR